MRILYSHRIQSRDGQSVHVEELIRAFREAGHEVMVVGPSFYAQSDFGGESRTIAILRRLLPGFLGELAELAYNLPAWWRLRRAYRSFRPDFVYERCNLYFLAGALLARLDGARLFLEVNSPLAEERARFGGLRLRWLAAALERWTWRSATRVLPVTRVLGDMLVAGGVDDARVRVVANGIVAERFPPRLAESAAAESGAAEAGAGVVLGFVGFVRAWHGLDTVIDALATEPDAASLTLVVVGDGPVREELEAQAARLGVADRVRFTGLVAHDAVAGHVLGFDIALQPSVTAYASPLKIFDYMAAGCAIVAPDQPNIREILEDGRTALLFDPADPGAQWATIGRLLREPALRVALGRAAREELLRRDYTWRGNAERIVGWAGEVR
jgi:glycosyltransferase involved in cell wall biosynthesis